MDRPEKGIALLIAIFVLLLISVVAIALIVSSGTESALAGNYRSATGVYYAALAGLEEARGRLVAKNPNSFKNTDATFMPAPGVTLPMGQVRYVVNPGPGEPGGTALLGVYPDNEYATEFGAAPSPGNVKTIASVSSAGGVQGPLYKWVRVNAVSEQSLNVDVDSDATKDNNPLYYDGTKFTTSFVAGGQVFEITSFAILPNSSQKILQYLAAGTPVNLPPFLAAVTLIGNNVDFTGPDSNLWQVNGNDMTVAMPGGNCAAGPPVWAIGYAPNTTKTYGNMNAGSMQAYKNNYTGQGGSTPNLLPPDSIAPPLPMPPNLMTPSGLDALAQIITKNADVVISGPAMGSDLPTGMSPSNLMTIVVNGDLNLTNLHNYQGYGLLLVTGTLTYDPGTSWHGIVLLIGQGMMTGSGSGSGEFDGALFAAKTRDSSGNLYPDPNLPDSNGNNIELPSITGGNMGGKGIYYSSCWITAAQPVGKIKILSFHEISQ